MKLYLVFYTKVGNWEWDEYLLGVFDNEKIVESLKKKYKKGHITVKEFELGKEYKPSKDWEVCYICGHCE